MKKVEKIPTIKEKLKKIDFLYANIDYDSNSMMDENHDELCANDYCRCSTLHPEITAIDTQSVADLIVRDFNVENEKVKYCIERICSTMKISDFYPNVSGGYYGEEMDSITLDNDEIVDRLEEAIDIKLARKRKIEKINKNDDDDKIRKILAMEYGYLLEDLKTAHFIIIEVDPNDIIFPVTRSLDEKRVEGYKNHSGICGIVKGKGTKYKVIDGYHRITANLNKNKIKVILSL